MKNVTVNAKKVGAGHFEVTVSNEEREVKFIETDMTIIDAFNSDADSEEEVEGTGYTRFEASNILINKSGI